MGVFREEIQGLAALGINREEGKKGRRGEERRGKNTIKEYFVYLYV